MHNCIAGDAPLPPLLLDICYVCTYYVCMNITLSARDELIEQAREYATAHGTSLNQLIRDHLEQLVGVTPPDQVADEFMAVAHDMGGDSSSSGAAWTGRDELYADRLNRVGHQ